MKKKLVVLSGAGISAESGIQTFRDGDGLWENHRIEDVATPEAWEKDPTLVLEFYNIRRNKCFMRNPTKRICCSLI
jgi:NAD-dependent deacetylase